MKKTGQYFLTISFLLLLLTCSAYAMPQKNSSGIIDAKVIETMDSGGYTYMLVDKNGNSEWVAIPQSSVKKGEEVHFYKGMVMKNFSSKTLHRTFETIVFSPGLVRGNAASPHTQKYHTTSESFRSAVEAEQERSSTEVNATTSGGSLAAIVPFKELHIEKINNENGYTVNEIFQNAEKLNGKEITLRGQIVKFSPMIMGRNWIHLQDGTGNAMQNEHDLVVTTKDQAKEGDIAVVRGIVTANKDFGAGYSYKVIIEQAVITKEQ